MASDKKTEKIVIVGYGWVGQANAIALAKMGYSVWFYDTAQEVNLHYGDDINEKDVPIKRANSIHEVDSSNTWYIVCVGDRVSDECVQDISLIKKATDALTNVEGKVILRSTVLPQKLSELHFDLYMPEFLHEKNAVDECLNPYYFVVGIKNEVEVPVFMKEWERRSHRTFKGTPEQASYIKYLSNIWNSIRIAFVNEMGDSMGNPKTMEDIKEIERVLDFVLERKSYLRYGQSFDGHCLPKDTRAYIGAHSELGKNVDLLKGAYASNENHKMIQEQNKLLPKVFSFWEYDKTHTTIVGLVWHRVNQKPFIKKSRKNLRFIMDGISSLIPDRSIDKAIKIWESKARENSAYFSNTRTKSGYAVAEEELRETGRSDFDRYVISDPNFTGLLGSGKEMKVLDFGSGVGRMTEFFSEYFGEVRGVDISKTMIENARKRLVKSNIAFDEFDGRELPYEDEYFDVVFSYLVLQYVPSVSLVEHYLQQIYHVLKKDGIAKVQLRGGRGVKKWEWSYGAAFSPEEAIALAERIGFNVIDHQVEGIKNIWLVLRK